jgi:hypothetical protein
VTTAAASLACEPTIGLRRGPESRIVVSTYRRLPELGKAVGDQRRVLVGFDRGGWSPALGAPRACGGVAHVHVKALTC